MADEISKRKDTTDETPSRGPSAESSAAPVSGPDKSSVIGGEQVDRTLVMEQVDRTLVMEQVDKTIVMSEDDPGRTIVLSEENGISRVPTGNARSIFDDTRSRIQTILHNPSSILTSLTGAGSGKRDVGAEIDSMDRHRERAEVGQVDEEHAHLTELDDRFEIERKLAEGGRYVVSVGQDVALERQVAVYSLRDERLLNPDERAHFVAEAEISAQLDHPSVLPVYAIRRDYRGGLHSAVKLTDGTDLRKYLNRVASHYRSGGFRAAEEAGALAFRLELILGITDGILYAHSRGVVHANLHPQNILIGEYHEVYIKGWGFAHILSDDDKTGQPKAKAPVFTDPRFIAPELISGSTPSPRCDIYALGMMLYETVTLHPPFPDASDTEVLEHLRNGIVPTVEHRFGGAIDPDIRAIILKAISPDPENRYATVEEMAEDLRHFLHSEEVSVRKISLSKRFAKLIRAHHRGMFFFFLMLIVLVGALFAYNIFNDVHRARISYLDDHVLGRAQASCRKTAHQVNLQAEKFNDMLSSIKFEIEFLLTGHIGAPKPGRQYIVPPDDKAVGGSAGIRTDYSPSYGDSVSFGELESGRAEDMNDPEFVRLGMILPTLFRCMLMAPVNAYVSKETLDRQIHRLTQNISPIYRVQIRMADGSSLHYPYTLKPDPAITDETEWYHHAMTGKKDEAFWSLPARIEDPVSGDKRTVLPVSIPLGPADAPVGAAAFLVSGRYIDQIMSKAENMTRGMETQYFITEDGHIKMERINNGPGKPPTVNLEKGMYPDPWMTEWLDGLDEKEFDAVIRKEYVYCCAHVPAMGGWYVEKIRLKDFLKEIDLEQKGDLQ